MKIRIEQHVSTPDYGHYPGQVLVDVPYERELLESGAAAPVPAEPETATLQPEPERAVTRRGRRGPAK
jgi:hypothetical protein